MPAQDRVPGPTSSPGPQAPRGSGRDLGRALREATRVLAEAGVLSPRHDAEELAAHRCGVLEGREVSRGEIAARALAGTGTVPEGFEELVAARASRIPLQHLTGRAPFRHLLLHVGPGVFVPRPETEVLVDELLEELRGQASGARSPRGSGGNGESGEPGGSGGSARPLVVDLATGSGALALAVATEVPTAEVVGVELSDLALAWARKNAADLDPAARRRLRLLAGDATTALPELEGTVDAVLSNPPYVPESMVPVDPEVAEHDPPLALYGGSADGLRIPRAFTARAAQLLRPGGFLVMEHAEVQAEAMSQIFRDHGFQRVRTVRDLTGRDRATAGYAGGRA